MTQLQNRHFVKKALKSMPVEYLLPEEKSWKSKSKKEDQDPRLLRHLRDIMYVSSFEKPDDYNSFLWLKKGWILVNLFAVSILILPHSLVMWSLGLSGMFSTLVTCVSIWLMEEVAVFLVVVRQRAVSSEPLRNRAIQQFWIWQLSLLLMSLTIASTAHYMLAAPIVCVIISVSIARADDLRSKYFPSLQRARIVRFSRDYFSHCVPLILSLGFVSRIILAKMNMLVLLIVGVLIAAFLLILIFGGEKSNIFPDLRNPVHCIYDLSGKIQDEERKERQQSFVPRLEYEAAKARISRNQKELNLRRQIIRKLIAAASGSTGSVDAFAQLFQLFQQVTTSRTYSMMDEETEEDGLREITFFECLSASLRVPEDSLELTSERIRTLWESRPKFKFLPCLRSVAQHLFVERLLLEKRYKSAIRALRKVHLSHQSKSPSGGRLFPLPSNSDATSRTLMTYCSQGLEEKIHMIRKTIKLVTKSLGERQGGLRASLKKCQVARRMAENENEKELEIDVTELAARVYNRLSTQAAYGHESAIFQEANKSEFRFDSLTKDLPMTAAMRRKEKTVRKRARNYRVLRETQARPLRNSAALTRAMSSYRSSSRSPSSASSGYIDACRNDDSYGL